MTLGGFLSDVPEGLRYSKDHEWAKIEGDRALVGVTDHAQRQLTDVVYVELPAVGKAVRQGEPLGVIESVKAVSEIFAPLSGEVVEVNQILEDSPEKVNQSPYADGWIVVLKLASPSEAERLMDAGSYRRFIGG